jgi:hypothetical protein
MSKLIGPLSHRWLSFRWEYLEITGGNHCAALLLYLFEFYVEANAIYGDPVPVNVTKTYKELEEDMFGAYKESMIRRAIKLLKEKGFLQVERWMSRAEGNLPNVYKLQPEAINAAISTLRGIHATK